MQSIKQNKCFLIRNYLLSFLYIAVNYYLTCVKQTIYDYHKYTHMLMIIQIILNQQLFSTKTYDASPWSFWVELCRMNIWKNQVIKLQKEPRRQASFQFTKFGWYMIMMYMLSFFVLIMMDDVTRIIYIYIYSIQCLDSASLFPSLLCTAQMHVQHTNLKNVKGIHDLFYFWVYN